MHDKSVYEVEYPDGTTDQLGANITAQNILSQVYSWYHYYKVLTDVTDHKIYDSAITKVNGVIKSIIDNLHQKRTTFS